MPRQLVVALALLVLLAPSLAAPASAQGPLPASASTEIDLFIREIPNSTGKLQVPIPPDTTRSLTLSVQYSWSAGGWSLDRTEIELRIDETPSWVEAQLNDTLVYADPPSQPGTAGNVTIDVQLNVTTTPDAPAFDPDNLFVFVNGHANDENGNLQEPDGDDQNQAWLLSAGVIAQVDLTAAQSLIQMRGGGTTHVGVDLQNTGNTQLNATLSARNVPDSLQVTLPDRVHVDTEQTRTVNMTVESMQTFRSSQGKFLLRAEPRYDGEFASRGPPSEFEVIVAVQDLPSAVLLGQQTLTEVFVFTAIFVAVSFVAAWPATTWWETRRKRKRAQQRGGAYARNRSKSSTSGSDRETGRRVYGIPAEGDDYVVIEDADVFAEVERRRGTRYGIPQEGDDYVIVDDEDLDEMYR